MLLALGGASAYSQSMDINVMSLNVWTTDSQTAKLAEVIQTGGGDIVGIQEMNGATNATALAGALGFHQHLYGTNLILSRYPIVGVAPNRGVEVELTPGHNAWVFNAHLTAYPYGPYDLRDNPSLTEAQLISASNSTRGAEANAFMTSIASNTTANDRVFFTGDFNEPSHLDWTAAAAAATTRTYDKAVSWPTSQRVTSAGFSDSFRTVRPDEVNDRGYTWTPGQPAPNFSSGNNEVHDRIDFVYHRGPGVTATSSNTVGPHNSVYGGAFRAEYHSDLGVTGYPTDHRAVTSGFTISGLQGSTLTFAGLPHNRGNATAITEANYGNRLVTSPNVEVSFAASANAHWDAYNGNVDSGSSPNNNWEWGVAQLQSNGSNSQATFDLALNSDPGFGVVLSSFDLVDYANFAAGHTVEWELWNGLPSSGNLLVAGSEIVAANQVKSVLTNYDETMFGVVTLRLRHVAGNGTDLAIDNIAFQQVPEPGTVALALLGSLALLGLRSKRS
ncbi:endonuclease/exonuclease/phosphatase family protein [Aeoliella sp. SH292]|uniref:endonuclease/exonuclease/phosphatase family protein n=1 Tax=Aeoliella sp. SH292 TaxID=3454464 RepID=UPI003F9871F0